MFPQPGFRASSAKPLARCPVCRYDLTGLPAAHRCPECGFAYDETMQVWWVPGIPGWVLGASWVLAFAFVQIRLSPALTGWFGLSYTEAAAAATLVTGVVPLCGMFFPRGFVAAGRDGLTYRFPFRPVQALSWSELRVTPGKLTLLRVRGGLGIPVRLPTVGLPRKRRRRIHAEIARHWEAARSHGGASDARCVS